MRQIKLRGLKRVDWFYRLIITAYNLVRMRRLIPIQALVARAEVSLEAVKTACGGKTTTEMELRNRLKARKSATESKRGNKGFSAACLAPEGRQSGYGGHL